MKTDAETYEAKKRLDAILMEAGSIIRDFPGLKIERIGINEHGIHTFHKVPGVTRKTEEAR